MYTAIRIKNFRSIKNTVFTVRNGLNVLVGSNGSGKTNVLSALKFISTLLTNGAAVALGKAGGPGRNFRRGESEISFVVVSHYETSIYRAKQTAFLLRWEVSLSLSKVNNLVQISRESVQVMVPGMDIIRAEVSRVAGQHKTSLYLDDEKLLTKKLLGCQGKTSLKKGDAHAQVHKQLADTLAATKKLPSDASILPGLRWLHSSVTRLLSELTSFDEYNIQPDVARQATDPLPLTRMGNDGLGVSEVINALELGQFQRLASRRIGPSYYQPTASGYGYGSYGYFFPHPSFNSKNNPLHDITENLRAAVSNIDKIETKIDPSTGRRFVNFRAGEEVFRSDEVSDGTIKWLCLLVAIYVPQSRVLLLEEPENFMHPWMQQRFISLVREQAKRLRSSVILTTHSATVLNALDIKELLLVHHGDEGTRVDEVADVAELQKVLDASNFGLGDMWVSGAFGAVTGAK